MGCFILITMPFYFTAQNEVGPALSWRLVRPYSFMQFSTNLKVISMQWSPCKKLIFPWLNIVPNLICWCRSHTCEIIHMFNYTLAMLIFMLITHSVDKTWNYTYLSIRLLLDQPPHQQIIKHLYSLGVYGYISPSKLASSARTKHWCVP
jgi:hypothetical protein